MHHGLWQHKNINQAKNLSLPKPLKSNEIKIGKKLHNFAQILWPYNRSITGNGVRKTLDELKKVLPKLKIFEVPSGTKAFDWTVPNEWNVQNAYIKTPAKKIICNFKENNLHLLGYSIPFKGKVTLQKLQKHLYSLPKMPYAIPYRTSYYKKRWGFCIADNQRKKLKKGLYEIELNSSIKKGHLTYAEYIVQGKTKKEILLSTWICHPSLANNELSGVVVTAYIAKWISEQKKPNHTFRFVFVPETIGSIVYLSRNLSHLKKNVKAGFCLSCLGDQRSFSYLQSRKGNTISDRAALHVLKWTCSSFKKYDWNQRGGDERQYCAPGIDLPIASVMRTKYGEYPEYHTSFDNLQNVVTPQGLGGGFFLVKKIIETIENNYCPVATKKGEPFLSKFNLRDSLGAARSFDEESQIISNILTWADGNNDLLEIANKINQPIWNLYLPLKKLKKYKLIVLKKQ